MTDVTHSEMMTDFTFDPLTHFYVHSLHICQRHSGRSSTPYGGNRDGNGSVGQRSNRSLFQDGSGHLPTSLFPDILVIRVRRDLADNRVFFQHPDLIRLLGIHETVMQLMVNTLNKAQQESAATETALSAIDSTKRSSSMSQIPTEAANAEPPKVAVVLSQLLTYLFTYLLT